MKASERAYPEQRFAASFRRAIETVKAAIPIEDVAREYAGDTLRQSGDYLMGRCVSPDHPDETPSMAVYPGSRKFRCYGCGESGDVVDLEKVAGGHGELWTAMLELSRRYGVELPQRPASWFRKQKRQQPVRDKIREARIAVLRRRLFAVVIIPLIKSTTPDGEAYKAEIETAWKDFQSVPVETLLDRMDEGDTP